MIAQDGIYASDQVMIIFNKTTNNTHVFFSHVRPRVTVIIFPQILVLSRIFMPFQQLSLLKDLQTVRPLKI